MLRQLSRERAGKAKVIPTIAGNDGIGLGLRSLIALGLALMELEGLQIFCNPFNPNQGREIQG